MVMNVDGVQKCSNTQMESGSGSMSKAVSNPARSNRLWSLLQPPSYMPIPGRDFSISHIHYLTM